jgi:hypothetical protein
MTSNMTSNMTTKMNNETHKVIFAKYTAYQYFAVPMDWKVEDCSVKYDTIRHKDGEEVTGVIQDDIVYTYPDDVIESHLELSHYDMYFSCDEDE